MKKLIFVLLLAISLQSVPARSEDFFSCTAANINVSALVGPGMAFITYVTYRALREQRDPAAVCPFLLSASIVALAYYQLYRCTIASNGC